IFTQITLAFILPLAIVFIVQMEISHHFFWKIDNNTIPYDSNNSHEATAMDWLYYALFTIAYYVFLTFFSVLSTAAVVFTIASIYTGREVIFRLGGLVVIVVILILYVYGFLYLSVVCQLASVVTVLENIHGFNALKKGKDLANGKKKVGMGIAFVLYGISLGAYTGETVVYPRPGAEIQLGSPQPPCEQKGKDLANGKKKVGMGIAFVLYGILVGLIVVYLLLVEYRHEVYKLVLIWRVMIGILCGIMLLMLFLMFAVTQTVLYLVCKSYHRESIDKLSLSTQLYPLTKDKYMCFATHQAPVTSVGSPPPNIVPSVKKGAKDPPRQCVNDGIWSFLKKLTKKIDEKSTMDRTEEDMKLVGFIGIFNQSFKTIFSRAYTGETVVYPGPGEEIQLGRPRVPAEQ
ncbi:hypothetical protein M8C21_018270, partial [Ambrosia artemisiifolia]